MKKLLNAIINGLLEVGLHLAITIGVLITIQVILEGGLISILLLATLILVIIKNYLDIDEQ